MHGINTTILLSDYLIQILPSKKENLNTCDRGAIIWLTGLSGSGKSTLAIGLERLLYHRGIATLILDGDQLRQGLCADLGFSQEDRRENIRRVGEVAKLFAKAGFVAIAALISPFKKERQLVRDSCYREGIPFMEVFVDAPLSLCEQRDSRGLYAKVRRGEIKEFTGIDSPYEQPEHSDLHLPTDQLSVEEALDQLDYLVIRLLNL